MSGVSNSPSGSTHRTESDHCRVRKGHSGYWLQPPNECRHPTEGIPDRGVDELSLKHILQRGPHHLWVIGSTTIRLLLLFTAHNLSIVHMGNIKGEDQTTCCMNYTGCSSKPCICLFKLLINIRSELQMDAIVKGDTQTPTPFLNTHIEWLEF